MQPAHGAVSPPGLRAALAGDTGRFQGPNGGKKGLLRRLPIPTIRNSQAGIAQLVERNLAKVEVASSNLVSRSSFQKNLVFDEVFSYPRSGSPIFQVFRPGGGAGVECQPAVRGSVAEWSCRGLQIPVRRFNSGPSLHYFPAFSFPPPAVRSMVRPGVTRYNPPYCRAGPNGEIGRRMGLKIPRPQGHAGSSPASGTRLRGRIFPESG